MRVRSEEARALCDRRNPHQASLCNLKPPGFHTALAQPDSRLERGGGTPGRKHPFQGNLMTANVWRWGCPGSERESQQQGLQCQLPGGSNSCSSSSLSRPPLLAGERGKYRKKRAPRQSLARAPLELQAECDASGSVKCTASSTGWGGGCLC